MNPQLPIDLQFKKKDVNKYSIKFLFILEMLANYVIKKEKLTKDFKQYFQKPLCAEYNYFLLADYG